MHPNQELLMYAAAQLEPLMGKLVFVGGCATGLLISDVGAPPIRVTKDVDVLVEVNSRIEYERVANQMRELGFKEDVREGAPICRWLKDSLILDVMPTNEAVFGFGNPWYEEALQNSIEAELAPGTKISILASPYFLLTKLAAFHGRGNGDYLMSHDLEDLISVIDGRPEIIEEINQANQQVKIALKQEFKELIADQSFMDALSGHLPTDSSSQARLPSLISKLKAIAKLGI